MRIDERILQELADVESVDSLAYAHREGLEHQEVVGAIKGLLALTTEYIKVEQKQKSGWILTQEGLDAIKNGSSEYNIYIKAKEGILLKELMKLPNSKHGFNKAMQLGWIRIDKKHENGPTVFQATTEEVTDVIKQGLTEISKEMEVPENITQDFKRRKLISSTVTKYYSVAKGADFKTTIDKPEADLTSDMISDGSWKSKNFKPYNFEAKGSLVVGGCLHPLLKVRAEFRRIFLDMGFSEMPTNQFVENGFWNFDALFQPQQHPARDAHDTFFISDPQLTPEKAFPSDYLERVVRVHEKGGYGSTGYNYNWKISEAQKNILRTHTTAVSARMLYKLAQEEFKPVKLFSIDRVFRNETLDATHLAEFHQIEGLIADRNLSLGHLIGILYAFFKKLGLEKLKFKPAYNPYTEPSMEIFSYHPGLKKWVEVGNSGIFRPEMLLPMGLPKDVNVIAWGLSLERPTMIKYGINNIRELIGPKVNVQMVRQNPICRLNKN